MRNYLKHWGFMRVLRLALGIFIVGQGIAANDWTFIVLGGLFSLMPLLNIGCCGPAGCYTPINKKINPNEQIKYEEIR